MSAAPSPPITATQVVANDLRFKASLGIGEQAYTSLRVVNRARELWDVLGAAGTGAAVAKSSVVAGTFFAPSGLLGALGLGTAATPVGWVALASVASGGACYGLYRLLSRGRDGLVIEIPRYLNTPLDQLGLAVFDLIAPLALRLAAVDGRVEAAELQHLKDYLCLDWGLDDNFVEQALAQIEPQASTAPLIDMARERAALLHAHPDCDHASIAAQLSRNLRDMLLAAGPLTAAEEQALQQVEQALHETPPSALSRAWEQAQQQARQQAQQARQQAQQVGSSLSEAGNSLSQAAATLAARTAQATDSLTQTAREAAADAAQRLAPAAEQLRQVADRAATQAATQAQEAAAAAAQTAQRLADQARRSAAGVVQQLPDLDQVSSSAKHAGAKLLGGLQSVVWRGGGR